MMWPYVAGWTSHTLGLQTPGSPLKLLRITPVEGAKDPVGSLTGSTRPPGEPCRARSAPHPLRAKVASDGTCSSTSWSLRCSPRTVAEAILVDADGPRDETSFSVWDMAVQVKTWSAKPFSSFDPHRSTCQNDRVPKDTQIAENMRVHVHPK